MAEGHDDKGERGRTRKRIEKEIRERVRTEEDEHKRLWENKRLWETEAVSHTSSAVSPSSFKLLPNSLRNTPQRIFWDQQILYNSLKDERQMRWHP